MPIKISKPTVQEFELTEIDEKYENEGEATRISVRQATQYEVEQREALNDKISRIFSFDKDEVELKGMIALANKKRLETYLVLCSCNILDEDGNQMFKFKTDQGISRINMSERDFQLAWGSLPVDVCEAIYKRVLEVNPMWQIPTW